MYMYADDILVVKSFKLSDTSIISSILYNDFQIILKWSISNGLHLNFSKSFYIIVGSQSFLSRIHSLDIFLDSTPITSPSTIKILGLHVDPLWSFEHHVIVKCRTAFAKLHILYPLRCVLYLKNFLSPSSFIPNSFDYADTVYLYI